MNPESLRYSKRLVLCLVGVLVIGMLPSTSLADIVVGNKTVVSGEVLKVADPVKVETAGTVEVQVSGVAIFSAGTTITLAPGFHAAPGSFFRAVAGAGLGLADLLDSDGDGMPDAWEIAHGLNPYGYDALADFNNNGVNNLKEYQDSQNATLLQNANLGLAVFTPNL